MSQIPRKQLIKLADNISALYRMGVITAETRNDLATCLQQGKKGLETLYVKTTSLPDHPALCAIREIILFD